MVHRARKLRPVHGMLGMLPADNRHDVLLDPAAWRRFPMRGHTVTVHQGLMYVIGGKLQGGKDASAHIHILSLPHVLNRKPALKASVQVSFKIWDHAACLLPPSPAMPHGCICVVAGRATSKLGFSNQAFLINPDPNHFDALTIPIRSRNGSKPFVVRSGCALLLHPHVPNAIILHGGRTVPGVENGKPHSTANGSQSILADWHLLTLVSQNSTSAHTKALVMESAELQRTSSVQQADLAACKHCLWPLGNPGVGSKGTSFPVLVCGGSAALEQRPLSTVDVDIKSMCVSLKDTSAGSGSTSALTSAACCANVPGSQGNHGLFLLPIRKPQPAVVVCAVDCQAGGRKWSVAQQRTLPSPACDTLTPLCVASAAATRTGQAGAVVGQGHGNSREHGVLVVAQGQTGDKHPALYVWADPGMGGKVSIPALHPAAVRAGQDRQMSGKAVLEDCSSYTGDYALPDSDPIRVDDLHSERPAAKAAHGRAGQHAVSAPANNASKRKSDSTAAVADTKRRRSSAPAPTAAQAGQGHQVRSARATNGLQNGHHKGPPVAGNGRNGAVLFGTTASDMKAAQQQLDLGDQNVIQETPEESMHEDLGQNAAREHYERAAHAAATHAGGSGRGRGQSRGAPDKRADGVLVLQVEVQQLRERAKLTGLLESEVASLQQTLEERVQHANKADEQLAALKQQLSDLRAALEREQACVVEARALKDTAFQRESNCERRLQAVAQQSEEEIGKLKKEVSMLQHKENEAQSSRDAFQARSKHLEHELSLAHVARTRDVAALQSRCSDLAKEKEECTVQQQKAHEQKVGLEEECSKLRAAGEQHQQQLESLRKKLEAGGKKLEEEEQRRLEEVKELQEHHKGHVCELDNRLRLERVNRDTAEARHASELQKYEGRLVYVQEAARMCQKGEEHSRKRAEELAGTLEEVKVQLAAAELDSVQQQETSAAHKKTAEQAQTALKTLQGELATVRKDLDDQTQKLQDAQLKHDEDEIVINGKKAQIVQLQQEKGDLVAFKQDMMRVAGERQKAMESVSAFQAAISVTEKNEAEAYSKLARKQPQHAAHHNGQ